jgi:hypothetical protein
MITSVTCPSCGTKLLVTEMSPKTFPCPRCLADLKNPATASQFVEPQNGYIFDKQASRVAVGVLIMIIAIGIGVTLSEKAGAAWEWACSFHCRWAIFLCICFGIIPIK